MAGRLRVGDALLAVTLAAGLVAVSLLLRGEDVAGRARAVDGDSLAVEGRRVRIKGIDAPELAQTCERAGTAYRCGEAARAALRDLIGAEPIACRVAGRDRYGRDLGSCRARDEDLGAVLVRRGLAVAYGDYRAEERDARARGVGLWAGTFEAPSAWRKRHAPAQAE